MTVVRLFVVSGVGPSTLLVRQEVIEISDGVAHKLRNSLKFELGDLRGRTGPISIRP